MKLAHTLMLLMPIMAMSQNLAQRCVALAASDFSNINRTEFSVTGAGDSVSVGTDLCADSLFRRAAGDFACRKPVRVAYSFGVSDDIVVSTQANSVRCCESNGIGCHLYADGDHYVINDSLLRADGMFPDPKAGQ